MKKRIVAVISILVILFFVIYLLTPSPERLSNQLGVKTSPDAAYRMCSDQETWNRSGNADFTLRNKLLNTVELNIRHQQYEVPVSLLFIPLKNDSVLIKWEAILPPVQGIFARWKKYSVATTVRDRIKSGLAAMSDYITNDINVYGTPVVETSTKDTFLVATRFITPAYPTLEEIDQRVQLLRNYATKMNARQSGNPMLNATDTDSGYHRCMIALPIDKIVPERPPVFFVRMVPGKFLTAEVKGGPHTIARAHKMMQQYFKDYDRISMAIPFEYMVTDRLHEPDTTKWITRIYGPVY